MRAMQCSMRVWNRSWNLCAGETQRNSCGGTRPSAAPSASREETVVRVDAQATEVAEEAAMALAATAAVVAVAMRVSFEAR